MIAAIGTALSVPAAPTNGATAAPITNWPMPSSAEAVPATAAWSLSASAVEFGSTNAKLDTMTNIGTRTATTPRPPTDTTTSSALAETAIANSPARSS